MKNKIDFKSQLARALADYENLKKRTEAEKLEVIKYANGKLILRLLAVLDMLEEAQKHLGDAGLAISLGEFKKIFEEDGVIELVTAKGDIFDENKHEAIEIVAGEKKEDGGKIAEVVLPGWQFTDGQVVRHAKVKVYKKI